MSKKTKLQCEDPSNCDWALRCFEEEQADKGNWNEDLTYAAAFEHGQIYIICIEEPRSWSVNDAEDQHGEFYWSFEALF